VEHANGEDLNIEDAEAEEFTGDILTETSQDASQSNSVQQLLKDMQADVCPAHLKHSCTT
jgi:hypothetical protein